MADSVSVDSSELDRFANDLGRIGAAMVPKVAGVVARGALQIKQTMNADLESSPSFRGIRGTVNYDLKKSVSGVEAVIGPDKSKHGGALANIAYFGGSRGGGGTVPVTHGLDEEEPRFIDALSKLVGGVHV